MIFIKLFLLLYFVILTITTYKSYGKGIILFWCSLLIFPYAIQSLHIALFSDVLIFQILIIIGIGLFYKTIRSNFLRFIKLHKSAVLIYFIVSSTIILFSQTVPKTEQFKNLLIESLYFIIIFLSYIYSRTNTTFKQDLFKYITICLSLNIVYNVLFELILRSNIAGIPLYAILGQLDNEYFIDMSEVQRGVFDFRMQSIFGHPLSLGQYFLILTPVYLSQYCKINKIYKYLLISGIIICIFLSGTRGAIFPLLFIIILFFIRRNKIIVFKQIFSLIFACCILYLFMPIKIQKKINDKAEIFYSYIEFWNDKKQDKKSMGGSTMQMRFDQFEAAQKEIKKSPLCGRGRCYREFYQRTKGHLHQELLGYESFVILKLVEQGWIGLLFFIIQIIYLYKFFIKNNLARNFIQFAFLAYFLSTLMTGIRVHSMLFLGLSCIIISQYYINTIKSKDHVQS